MRRKGVCGIKGPPSVGAGLGPGPGPGPGPGLA